MCLYRLLPASHTHLTDRLPASYTHLTDRLPASHTRLSPEAEHMPTHLHMDMAVHEKELCIAERHGYIYVVYTIIMKAWSYRREFG